MKRHQDGSLFQCGVWALVVYEWFVLYSKDHVAAMSFGDFFHRRCLPAMLATSRVGALV